MHYQNNDPSKPKVYYNARSFLKSIHRAAIKDSESFKELASWLEDAFACRQEAELSLLSCNQWSA